MKRRCIQNQAEGHARTASSMTAVARALGIERSNAYQKCKRLGVKYKDEGDGEG